MLKKIIINCLIDFIENFIFGKTKVNNLRILVQWFTLNTSKNLKFSFLSNTHGTHGIHEKVDYTIYCIHCLTFYKIVKLSLYV